MCSPQKSREMAFMQPSYGMMYSNLVFAGMFSEQRSAFTLNSSPTGDGTEYLSFHFFWSLGTVGELMICELKASRTPRVASLILVYFTQ